MEMKKCTDCGEVKPLSDYYKLKSQKDGHHYYCKVCCLMHRRGSNVGKRDRKNGISYRQRHRSRYEGAQEIDDTITMEALFRRDRGICGICGLKVDARDASIDHIIPIARGGTHVWTNVQLTHKTCNQKKSVSEIRKSSLHSNHTSEPPLIRRRKGRKRS